jgi:phage gpG-like protein
MLQVRVTGLDSIKKLTADFTAIQKRSSDHATQHADAGWYLRNVMRNGMLKSAYPANSPWPRSYRASGRPLIHRRRLLNSISYASSSTLAVIGTMDPAAAVHDGVSRVIRPRHGKYLAIPLSPPLSPGEADRFRTARVPGGFVLGMKSGTRTRGKRTKDTGYRGPGVYRRNGNMIERVKAFVTSVRTVNRSLTNAPMMAAHEVPDRWIQWIFYGHFNAGAGGGRKAPSEGNPIVNRDI